MPLTANNVSFSNEQLAQAIALWLELKNNTLRGNAIRQGTVITGTSTTPTAFETGIALSKVDDIYINTATLNYYTCTAGGDEDAALWSYSGSMLIEGTPGRSAYQIWLDNGNVGSEAQFLASLKAGIDDIYPVGAIYLSMVEASPASLFGGTWAKIEGQFLLGASDTYAAGTTGGSATHTLTVNEMPSHKHKLHGWRYQLKADDYSGRFATTGPWTQNSSNDNANQDHIDATGGGQPHNNMPPYLAVHIWKRTA